MRLKVSIGLHVWLLPVLILPPPLPTPLRGSATSGIGRHDCSAEGQVMQTLARADHAQHSSFGAQAYQPGLQEGLPY